MTFEQAKKYAKGVLEKKRFAKVDAPKKSRSARCRK